ncbi:transcriptional regulator PerR [Acidimicrobiaceae bacterium]|nr:transcriptional regulator PerR [Acidimicrobiaceae bacterium]
MRTPTELAQVFREKQLKLTPQRQLLFNLLHDNESHPTAESLFEIASKQMPGISLRTIYQTLGELAEMKELQLVDIGNGATRFDPNMSEHQHFVCDSCGAIHDVDITSAPKLRAGSADGFAVEEIGVVFRGRCGRCNQGDQSRQTTKRSPGLQAKNKAS